MWYLQEENETDEIGISSELEEAIRNSFINY